MNPKAIPQQKIEFTQREDRKRRYYIGLAKKYANMNSSPITSDESFLEMIGKMIHQAQQEK